MKYLKKFENHAAYAAAESGLILPNVSLCVQENEVHYNPDPCRQHDYIEIGGIKWATKNVGACEITDYGLYFQWGDTKGYTAEQVGSSSGGKKEFGWQTYKYGNRTNNPGASGMTKYNSTDGLTTLQPSDDAATAAWGGSWRMPTTDEFQALSAAVNTEWVTDYQGSGVAGFVLTDKIDNTKVLFFPACGYGGGTTIASNGILCAYWSSSRYTTRYAQQAYYVNLSSSYVNWKVQYDRRYGLSIRPVVG